MTLDLGRRTEKAFQLPAPPVLRLMGEPLLAFETILKLMAHGRVEQKHRRLRLPMTNVPVDPREGWCL